MSEASCGKPGCTTIHRWERFTSEDLLRQLVAIETDSCVNWTMSCTADGYGQCRVDGRQRFAHQVACEWAHGPRPDGMEVRHLCGNASCVNQRHIAWDTHQENMLDRNKPERYLKGTR